PEGAGARPVRAVSLDRLLEPARAGVMPDLRGLSARDAVRTLTAIGMTARMTGDGFVIDQSPDPGTPLVPGAASVLRLGRQLPIGPSGAPQ
ncbi:MAG TPA: PASTA domain-containing protein, partial [Vicinamibacterales bacterium]|nr:PASTA domain-containing protein [Vicinamibacterales bacterium]